METSVLIQVPYELESANSPRKNEQTLTTQLCRSIILMWAIF